MLGPYLTVSHEMGHNFGMSHDCTAHSYLHLTRDILAAFLDMMIKCDQTVGAKSHTSQGFRLPVMSKTSERKKKS